MRALILSSVRKMIQNIKEIIGNYSEDEIYAVPKECSMDPHETAQKLLLQGNIMSFCSFLLGYIDLDLELFFFWRVFLT